MSKIQIVCATCGSTNVMKDAWAEWDFDKQDWVLHSLYDDAYCEDCEGECHLEEQPVREFTSPPNQNQSDA